MLLLELKETTMKNLFFNKMAPIVLTVFISFNLSAKTKPAIKFGKIEKADIEQKVHPVDSSASAAYLYKSARAFFDINAGRIRLVVEHHERIKIYDEDAESYADFEFILQKDGSTRERLTRIQAATYNIENNKIKTTELNKKDIYKEKVSDDLEKEKFALPDVKAGSVIEVKYTFSTPWLYTIPSFYFQEYIPVDEALYEIRIPNYYSYTPIPTGTIPLTTSQKKINGDYGLDVVYTYGAKNIPAVKEDDYVLNTDDYRSGLKYEIYSSQFPDSHIEYFSKDWNEISKDLMDSRRFGKQLGKRTKELEPFINSLSRKTQQEKILAIYEHVRTKYKWNGSFGKYRSHNGVNEFIKEKSGNVADINQLLINLLLQADVRAFPFLIKSRGNGILNDHYPSMTELNYLLAYVELEEGGYVLLDASSKYTPLGNLPVRATNINGLLLKGGEGQIVNLSSPNTYKTVTMVNYEIDVDKPSLEGEGKAIYKNYAGILYRKEASKVDDDGLEEEEENDEEDEEDEEDFLLENEFDLLEAKNVDDIYKDVSISFNKKIYNEISAIGDQIFLDATLDFGMDKNPFFEESRDYPVFFRYKYDNRYIVNVLDYKFKVNTDFYVSSEYQGLKEIYRLVIEKTKEKVVLTKKA